MHINIKPKVFTVLEDITRKYKHLKTGKQTKRPSSFNENRMADKNGIEEIHIKYKKQRPLDIVKDLEIPRLKKDTKDISHEVAELSNSKSTIELGRVDLFTFCKIRNYYKNIYFEYPKRNNVNVEDQSSKLLQMNNTMNTQQNRVFRSSFKHKNMNNNNETNMIDKNDSMYLPLSKIFQEDPSQKWIELSPDYQEKFTFGNNEESARSNQKNKRSKGHENYEENNYIYLEDNGDKTDKFDSLRNHNVQQKMIKGIKVNEDKSVFKEINHSQENDIPNENKNVFHKKIMRSTNRNPDITMNPESSQNHIQNGPLLNLDSDSSPNQLKSGIKKCNKRNVSYVPKEEVIVEMYNEDLLPERSFQDEVSVNSKRITNDYSDINENETKEYLKTNDEKDSVIERHEICLNQRKSLKSKSNSLFANNVKVGNTTVQEGSNEYEEKTTLPSNSITKLMKNDIASSNYYYKNTIPSEETYFGTDHKSNPIETISYIPTDRKSTNQFQNFNVCTTENSVYKSGRRTFSETNYIYSRFSNLKYNTITNQQNKTNIENIDFFLKIREKREALENQYSSKKSKELKNYNFLNLERSSEFSTFSHKKYSGVVIDYEIGAFKHISVKSPKLERYHPRPINKKRPTKRNNNISTFSPKIRFMDNSTINFCNNSKSSQEYSVRQTTETSKSIGIR